MKYNIGEFISIKGYNNTSRKKLYGREVLIFVEDRNLFLENTPNNMERKMITTLCRVPIRET
ncbi:hypothetical protein SAMN05428947_10912 [Mucilaginibacter sp. OK283]|nr:hypothetical protein SAMN05428947_10912 [Mucilaginibacter sp. OK283]